VHRKSAITRAHRHRIIAVFNFSLAPANHRRSCRDAAVCGYRRDGANRKEISPARLAHPGNSMNSFKRSEKARLQIAINEPWMAFAGAAQRYTWWLVAKLDRLAQPQRLAVLWIVGSTALAILTSNRHTRKQYRRHRSQAR
jgi:hypothetical protein